jgi:hypothetical protein
MAITGQFTKLVAALGLLLAASSLPALAQSDMAAPAPEMSTHAAHKAATHHRAPRHRTHRAKTVAPNMAPAGDMSGH